MKHTHVCPKCAHRVVVRFPRVWATNNELSLDRSWLGGADLLIEAYACGKCGYTELFGPDRLGENVQALEDAELLVAPPDGGYR